MSENPDTRMQIWRPYAADMARLCVRAGWPAILGLSLSAFAVAYEYSGNQATRLHIAEIAAQRTDMRALAKRPIVEAPSARAQLDRFYQGFPASNALPDALLQLDKLARTSGLSPLRADYRAAPELGTPLQQVRVSIPVHGSYKDLRTWMATVQKSMPAVAVDSIDIKRNDIGIDDMEAQVRFAVFLRTGQGAAE